MMADETLEPVRVVLGDTPIPPGPADPNGETRDANRDALGRFGQGNNVGVTFPPGTTGNPNGAPRAKVELTRLLSERLEQTGEDGRTWAERVMDKLVAMADAGNMEAVKYLTDRIEGKPAQAVTLTLDEGPLHHRLPVRDNGPRPRALAPGEAVPCDYPHCDWPCTRPCAQNLTAPTQDADTQD